MTLNIIQFLESHMMTCPYKALSGFDCPGCGMQRSFIELLKGNFIQSLHFYPALFPVIFTLIITALHLRFKYKNGAQYIKYSFVFTMGVVIIGYSAKMFL